MKKIYVILGLLFVAAFALEMVNVYLANKVSEGNIGMRNNQKLLEQLDEENMRLRSDILRSSNFTMIASRAALLGFSDESQVISLYDPLELAIRNERE